MMDIVVNSYYDHERFGRVQVVGYNNGVVSMELQDDDLVIGTTTMPRCKKQSAAGFQDEAEPADVTVNVDPVKIDVSALNGEIE